MIHRISFLASMGLLFLATSGTQAQISHPEFTSYEGLRPIGAVMLTNGAVAMTYAGAMQSAALWSETKQQVAPGFTTTFTFRVGGDVGGIVNPDRTRGADGFAFVVHNGPAESVGGMGHCLGYEGLTNSIAIEFDTWLNPDCGDPNGNHVSIHTRGLLFNSARHAYALGTTTDIPNLSDGALHTGTITYVPGTLSVQVDGSPPLVVSVDLASTLSLDNGSAWVGFTSATGRAWEEHDILSWTFDVQRVAGGKRLR